MRDATTISAVQAKPIVGVDIAKNCFQMAEADAQYRIERRQRLTRTKFSQSMANRAASLVVMEACGSAQHWARVLQAQGHEVRLLPAQHVRAYVRRNKTDAADAAALVEASRSEQIKAVAIKTVEQQVLQQLHRLRTQWQAGRTARINALRGMLREFGLDVPVGAARGLAVIREHLQLGDNGLPDALRPFIAQLLSEIYEFERQVKNTDNTLKALTRTDTVVEGLQRIPGIGVVVCTAVRAAVPDIHRFASARHFASWMGLTPREYSSGERRRLGCISKQGDVYLRTQLIQGARSVLLWGKVAQKKGRPLDGLRRWAVQTERRVGYNKATVAVANKLARIIWATWKHGREFDGDWARASGLKAMA